MPNPLSGSVLQVSAQLPPVFFHRAQSSVLASYPAHFLWAASAYILDTGQGPAKEAVTAKFTLLLNSYQVSVQTDTAEVNSSRPVSQGVGRLSIESPHSSLGLVLSEDVPKLKETHQEGPAHLDDFCLGLVFLLHGLHRGQREHAPHTGVHQLHPLTHTQDRLGVTERDGMPGVK